MEDLEDDIELDMVPEVKQPRKLSRLKRVDAETKESKKPGAQNSMNLVDLEVAEPDDAPANGADEEAEAEDVDCDDDGEEAGSEGYWDEEDEIEKYLQDRLEGVSSSDDEDAPTAAGDAPADTDGAPPLNLGNSPTMADLNAETQRILRETAARDRLGKGQKIEIKPMSSIIEKLRERRALAIARAPKAKPRSVVDFDDVLAAATEQAAPATDSAVALASATAAPIGGRGTGDGNAAGVAEIQEEAGAAAAAAGGAAVEAAPDAGADLDIVSEDDEAEGAAARVVELPSTARRELKPSPLAYLPYTQSRELEFEEEVLLEDGAGSDDDSDAGTERSWEVGAGGQVGTPGAVSGLASDDVVGGDGVSKEEEEESAGGKEGGQDELQVKEDARGPERQRTGSAGASQESGAAGGAGEGPSPVGDKAAAGAPPKHARRLQRVFLDMEAELSDEDGAAGSVSEDEDEDEVDERGELGDLIASGDKERGKDKEAKELLHRKWEQQKDAKELQQVLRGLEQGFRRRRGGAGALDSEDEELDGRRRRARMGGGDDGLDGGGRWLEWPAAWGAGGGGGADEEEELAGEELLRRAKQQRLVAESRGPSQASPGAVPLDEDSQAVLGMLRFSESQQGWAGVVGSEATRGPSFLGRQPSVARTTGALGLGGGKSFVFGQRDCSNSGAPDAAKPGSQGTGDEPVGPISFANLRQMAGLPGGGAGSKRQRGGASFLVSRLGGQAGVGKAAPAPQPTVDAASAFCQHVLAPRNRRRK